MYEPEYMVDAKTQQFATCPYRNMALCEWHCSLCYRYFRDIEDPNKPHIQAEVYYCGAGTNSTSLYKKTEYDAQLREND